MSMTDFDDMTKRILDKLDTIENNVDDLCGRLLRVEMDLKNHFAQIETKQKSKDRKFYIVIAGMGIAFTLVEIIQNV